MFLFFLFIRYSSQPNTICCCEIVCAAAAASTPKTPNSSAAITTITPTAISTPITAAAKKEDGDLSAKLNNIVVASNALPHVSAISSVASSSSVALPSTILTSSNMTVATNNNQSYQLLFATVPKTSSHPRIKYSGLKKSEDMAPLIVEAMLPANAPSLTANTANILDISGITPIMTAPLQQLSTITIPTQKNPQIINISNNDLSPAIKYADIDDIELPDGTKIGYPTESEMKRIQQHSQSDSLNDSAAYTSNLAEKYSILAATALKNFDLSLNDSATLSQSNGTIITNNGSMNEVRSIMVSGSTNESTDGDGGEELFACRHCGKKYRWKSTLRRHENDECGDKEPSHQCPYCPYKAKQRGNLGVHVRKHHANMPQLESRRKRKT